jgi:hypothetical protein
MGMLKSSKVTSRCLPLTCADLAIVNIDAVPFQLGQRMDGVALSGVSILMHDENHWSTVGMGDRTSHDESVPLHDVPINTLNVHVSVRLIIDLYNSTVISCNTPISTLVNESTGCL